jgi:3-isopropylmalate/(R)-2-methylmalate dehydratase large subunit
MGHTIAEKILARCASQASVRPGEYIWARVDQTDADANHLRALDQLGVRQLAAPDTVWVTSDHYAPATDQHYANQDNLLRKYVRRYEIPHFFEYGRHGIMHQLFGEQGAILPGTLSAMSDSHSTSGGVFNAFATPVGRETIFVLATGTLWLCVPETVRFELTGRLPLHCYGKDVVLRILREHGSGVGIYKALEFGGPGLRPMTIDSRWTLSNMGIEMGAKAAICEYDDRLGRYLGERTTRPYEPAAPDADCRYAERHAIDLDALEPLVACPHDPSNVKPASALEGENIRVSQVFLGSCTNGRLEDLAIAASLLKGKQVHPDVRMIVSPSSQTVWRQALDRGVLGILADAGALVSHSTCGPCFGGHLGVLGDGDVCMSSSNRNFKGRMGSPDAFVYLGNAATVAAAAVAGKIVDPRNVSAERVV